MTKGQLRAALEVISIAKTIAVSGHMNPDGDCIGSLLALGLGLSRIGKEVHFLSSDGVPKKLRSLPGTRRVKKTLSRRRLDLAISVDCNKKEMLGKNVYRVFRQAKKILEIDHHSLRESFGDIQLIRPQAACVGEIVYDILSRLKVKITPDIARNILASVIIETNSFRLPTVTSRTFSLCRRLLETGVDFHKLSELVYWSRTKEEVLLSGLCLSRCRFLAKGKIVWSIVHSADFSRMHARDEDIDAVANEMLAISGVEAAVLFRQKRPDTLRVSLRSKGKVNVARVAEACGGGGHFDSAGCFLKNAPNEINSFLRMLEKTLSGR